MTSPLHDPWQDRLSDYLDGELGAQERAALEAHLAGCAPCRTVLADLRAVVTAARALVPREPARDLWPALRAELAPRAARSARATWILAFAAGILATLGALLVLRALPAEAQRSERVAVLGERYLFLLREPEGFGSRLDPAQHAALVERYSHWAMDLGERCLGGDELDEARAELLPGAEQPVERSAGERVGGYFLVVARDRAEALELARTCPHLEQGGSIEVRRIRIQK